MNTFAVCRYDPNAYSPKVTDLERFETYDEAYEYYKMRVLKLEMLGYLIPKDWWLAFIDENDRIVQLQQLDWRIKSTFIEDFEG